MWFYKLFLLSLQTKFSDNVEILEEFRGKDLSLVLFFHPLGEQPNFDLTKLVELVAERAFMHCIFIIADRSLILPLPLSSPCEWSVCFRETDRDLAKKLHVPSESPIVVLPKGIEKNMIPLELGSPEDMKTEAFYLSDTLISIAMDHNIFEALRNQLVGVEAEATEAVPTLSVTDLSGIKILVSNTNFDLIVSFCKKGVLFPLVVTSSLLFHSSLSHLLFSYTCRSTQMS